MILTWEEAVLWLIQCGVGGGLVLLVTWLLMNCARQPALKQRLGECGLCAALAVAGLSLLPSWLIVHWNVLGSEGAAEQVARTLFPEVPRPAPVPLTLKPLPAPDIADLPEAGAPGVVVVVPPHESVPPAPDADESVANTATDWVSPVPAATLWCVIVSAYLMGVGWFLVRLGVTLASLMLLVRRTVSAPQWMRQLVQEVDSGGHVPELLVSYRLRTPMSFGLFRPTIVLPAAMCANPDAEKLRWTLRHELTHLRRGDSWSSLLCVLARAMYFYWPWSWIICRQVRLCQEFLADAIAVENEDRRADYAEFLLSFTKSAPMPLVATGVSGNGSDLFRRVTMLLEKPIHVEHRPARRRLWSAAVILLALAVAVSGVGLRAQAQEHKIIIVGGSPGAKVQDGKPEIKVLVLPEQHFQAGDQKVFIKKIQPGQFEIEVDVHKPVAGDKFKAKVIDNQFDIFVPAQGKEIKVIEYGPIGGKKVQVEPFDYKVVPAQDKLRLTVPQAGSEDLHKAIQKLQDARTADEKQAAEKDLMKAVHKMLQEHNVPFGVHGKFVPAPGAEPWLPMVAGGGKGKLGATFEVPSKILADQLNLPKGQGLVVTDVAAGSAADKAGLKLNDILLKFDGKAVPNSVADFTKMVGQVKADAAVDVVVLRKGKEQTLQGLMLPKQATQGDKFWAPVGGGFGVPFGGQAGVSMNLFRNQDSFNCRYQEGSLIITLHGKVNANNQAQVEQIHIQDGAQVSKHDNIKDVAAQHRDKVNFILDTVNKGTVQIQIQGK